MNRVPPMLETLMNCVCDLLMIESNWKQHVRYLNVIGHFALLTLLCVFQKALLSDSHSNARDGEAMAFLEKYDVKLLHLLGSEQFNVYDYIHAVEVHHKVGSQSLAAVILPGVTRAL